MPMIKVRLKLVQHIPSEAPPSPSASFRAASFSSSSSELEELEEAVPGSSAVASSRMSW